MFHSHRRHRGCRMTAPSVELVRHMQWWALRMLCDELRYGDTNMPAAPVLSIDDAQRVHRWLHDCAEQISPGITVDVEYQQAVGQ